MAIESVSTWRRILSLVSLSALFMVAAVDVATAQSKHHRHATANVLDANGNDGSIIGGRPAGCPHNYCGCGLRIYLGISDKRFNLAWNWARFFPRTSAHAGAAAVRRGHVMLLENQVSGSVWIVRDYNSGNGLSRVHERDVRGYIFVDPHGAQKLASRS